jgi:hypothetical protein
VDARLKPIIGRDLALKRGADGHGKCVADRGRRVHERELVARARERDYEKVRVAVGHLAREHLPRRPHRVRDVDLRDPLVARSGEDVEQADDHPVRATRGCQLSRKIGEQ